MKVYGSTPPTPSLISKISDHIYWMKPADPDRPSLCAVVGQGKTLMLDAGASNAHTGLFLNSLVAEGIKPPAYAVLTHWHWDHSFGAAVIDAPIIAQQQTGQQLAIMRDYRWDDAALDGRVASGQEIAFCADNIKLELPAPRTVKIAVPDIIFADRLDCWLGNVTCQVVHVGGDHAADSTVIYVAEDQVLFLGDCLYEAVYAPVRHYTADRLFPLLDRILAFEAQHFIEGHTDSVMSRAEIERMAGQMRYAGNLMEQHGVDLERLFHLAREAQQFDDDMESFLRAFVAGKQLAGSATV